MVRQGTLSGVSKLLLTLPLGLSVLLAAPRFRCFDCELIPCAVCGDQPRSAFSVTAVNNIRHKAQAQQVRCIDCSHPECANPQCRTCRRCRALTCRGGAACSGVIRPLHAHQQPKSVAEKLLFRCERCQYPPCTKCKKEMPKGSRLRFLASGKDIWTCGDCMTVEENKRVLAKYK